MKRSLLLAACGFVVSAASVTSAQSVYETSFEETGDPSGVSFTTGDLGSQGGWQVVQGSANVEAAPLNDQPNDPQVAGDGSQFVNQQSNSIIRRSISGASGDRAIVRGKYYGEGSQDLSVPTTDNPIAALIGFRNSGANLTVEAYNGTTDQFEAGASQFPVNTWLDVTLNIRYNTANDPLTFDVLVNGAPHLMNVPFSDDTVTSLSGFESHAESRSNTDDLGFFISDGDFDDDGFLDDEEFDDVTLDPFTPDPPRSLAFALGKNPVITNNQTYSRVMPSGQENWHPIDVSNCTNIRIEASSNNGADIQIALFDARLREVDASISEIRISESLAVNITEEELSYINNSGAGVLYLRIYEEGANQDLDYDLLVSTEASDDIYEPNNFAGAPASVAFGAYQNLILKDDDFYAFDTSGVNSIDIQVDHDFDFGQIYTLVTEATAPFNIIAGNFTFNQDSLTIPGLDVSGLDAVVVRVYGASLVTANTYDLTVTDASKANEAIPIYGADDGTVPSRTLVADSMLGGFLEKVSTKQSATDDGFEVNDTLESVENATELPVEENVDVRLENDDWYRIPLRSPTNSAPTQSARITVSFDNADSNIGLELIDARCLFDQAGGRLRVAQSFGNTNEETVTFVNSTAAEYVYLRVFDQEFNGSNTYNQADYTVFVDLFDDDSFETGGTPGNPAEGLPIGQTVNNLILKDDDFFRIDLSNASTVTVTLEHDFNIGQIYLQLLEDNGGFQTLNGDGAAQSFTANSSILTLDSVDVSSNNSAVIRVFAANRGTNFYSLRVDTN